MSSRQDIYVLGKRVWLRQPEEGFRTSLDSVMLAAACPVAPGDSVLDMGCGVGGAGLCVAERCSGTNLTGIDIQGECIELANLNAEANGKSGQSKFMETDVRYFKGGKFDHVICNPPYMEYGAHTPSPRRGKALSMGHVNDENPATLEDWINAGFRHLKSKGSLTVIHRGDALVRIIQALGRRFGKVAIVPLWPKVSEPAKRVIVRAVKDSRSPSSLLPGIILHNADGSSTGEAERILRDGHPIP